jgi:hypothetical protein
MDRNGSAGEHDPEKWNPVFGKDHAQAKKISDGFDSA